MKIRLEDLKSEEPNVAQKMMTGIGKQYRSFNDYVAFQDNDTLGMLTFKIMLRLVGIIFMLLISPFVILGLIIAFAAVF